MATELPMDVHPAVHVSGAGVVTACSPARSDGRPADAQQDRLSTGGGRRRRWPRTARRHATVDGRTFE
jgi:hypothetical protein